MAEYCTCQGRFHYSLPDSRVTVIMQSRASLTNVFHYRSCLSVYMMYIHVHPCAILSLLCHKKPARIMHQGTRFISFWQCQAKSRACFSSVAAQKLQAVKSNLKQRNASAIARRIKRQSWSILDTLHKARLFKVCFQMCSLSIDMHLEHTQGMAYDKGTPCVSDPSKAPFCQGPQQGTSSVSGRAVCLQVCVLASVSPPPVAQFAILCTPLMCMSGCL